MLTTCDSLSTYSALQEWVHFSSFPRLQKPNWFQLIASKIEPHSNLPFKTGGWGLSSQEISYVNISRGRNILAMWKKNRPLQNRLTLHVFMVLWFGFFDLVVLLKPGALLHKFTFSGTFLKSVLVFWRIFSCSPRVIFTCQFAFCRAISAKLMQQVGWGLQGGPNLLPPIHCIPDRTPLFL